MVEDELYSKNLAHGYLVWSVQWLQNDNLNKFDEHWNKITFSDLIYTEQCLYDVVNFLPKFSQ